MRLLLLGGSGQVGTEIQALRNPPNIEVVAPHRDELDLKDSKAIAQLIAQGDWSAVINAAAYTDVDRAESEPSIALAVNAEAPTRIAAETERRRIPLVHISTDYVFDGRQGVPYIETDEVAPLNTYGVSKLAGERGVCAGNPRHIVLRTSWIYSPFGKNFVKTILRLAAERQRLTIVADQRGRPTAARDVAQVCLDIASRCALEPHRVHYGIYHYAGAGDATWFEFAKTIVELAADRIGKSPEVVPIRTIDYPTPAKRPADTRLDCTAIVREFGVKARFWQEALAETIDRLLNKEDVQ
jgi:dTDP-4-dehydrorhamnose reductase